MPSNEQASLATSVGDRRDSNWIAVAALLFLLLASQSTFVHPQIGCGPEEYLNRTAFDAAENYTTTNGSRFCSRCDTVPDFSYCTTCEFNVSDSQIICTGCSSGLEVRDGVCVPSAAVEVPTWVIIVAVSVTVGGSVCIIVVALVVYKCRSGGRARTTHVRRKLPSPEELDGPPPDVTAASTEFRTGALRKLSTVLRRDRYTAGPEGDPRRTQGVNTAGTIGNSRPTVLSVHYEPSAVQTSPNNGRPTPPIPGPTETTSPRGKAAIPNGNGNRIRVAEPLRPERPVSLVPDPGPQEQEIYMNTSARPSPAHSHTHVAHEFSNPSFTAADPGQNFDDNDDGEVYANNTEISLPGVVKGPAMTSPTDDVDPPDDFNNVQLPDDPADGREYVNVIELRQQMEKHKQQQRGGGRVVQDEQVLVEEPDEQEVYENVIVQAPEKTPAHRRQAPARR